MQGNAGQIGWVPLSGCSIQGQALAGDRQCKSVLKKGEKSVLVSELCREVESCLEIHEMGGCLEAISEPRRKDGRGETDKERTEGGRKIKREREREIY